MRRFQYFVFVIPFQVANGGTPGNTVLSFVNQFAKILTTEDKLFYFEKPKLRSSSSAELSYSADGVSKFRALN